MEIFDENLVPAFSVLWGDEIVRQRKGTRSEMGGFIITGRAPDPDFD